MAPLTCWITPDSETLADVASAWLWRELIAQDQPTLGLATGSTPLKVYERLATYTAVQPLANLHCFHLDEYLGMAPHDPRCYNYYIRQHVMEPLGLSPEQGTLWNGMQSDPQAACAAYEAAITARGGITHQILGLGRNGHIGFNEPGTNLSSRTHVVPLTPDTLQHNAPFLSGGPMPTHAFTMGVSTILEAQTLCMLVTGPLKADALHQLFTGPIEARFPASAVRTHSRVLVIADAAAAASSAEWKGIDVHELSSVSDIPGF